MLSIKKVTGNSLSPFFLSGDYVLVFTWYRDYSNIKPGDLIVFSHSEFGQMIKFVMSNDPENGELLVTGSSPDSISTHKLGPIPYTSILGKVILPFRKAP